MEEKPFTSWETLLQEIQNWDRTPNTNNIFASIEKTLICMHPSLVIKFPKISKTTLFPANVWWPCHSIEPFLFTDVKFQAGFFHSPLPLNAKPPFWFLKGKQNLLFGSIGAPLNKREVLWAAPLYPTEPPNLIGLSPKPEYPLKKSPVISAILAYLCRRDFSYALMGDKSSPVGWLKIRNVQEGHNILLNLNEFHIATPALEETGFLNRITEFENVLREQLKLSIHL